MSITDELREYVNQTPVPKSRVLMEARERFNAIADRIDAEHEAKVSYWQGASYKDGYDEGFASADDWLAQHEDAMAEHGWVRKDKEHIISHATIEVTPHIDWSRMADELNEFVEIVRGMLIVGHSSTRTNGLKLRRTQMQFTDEQQRFIDEHYQLLPKDADGEYIHVGDVMEWPTTGETFEVVGIGEGTLFYVEDGSECADWTGASTKRHHHAPTVEDVLREFASEVYADADNEIRDRDFLCAKYAKRLTLAEGEDA